MTFMLARAASDMGSDLRATHARTATVAHTWSLCVSYL